jgi:integrase
VTNTRRTKKAPAVGQWSAEAGLYPFKVIVEENRHRRGALYLRWWNTGAENWKRESLGNLKTNRPLRDVDGEIIPGTAQWAAEQAMKKSQQLSGSLESNPTVPKHRVTIGEIEALITDPTTGKYPHKTPFRDELVRAIRFAVTVWGKDTPADTIDEAAWTKLARVRLSDLVKRKHVGARAAEITVSRLITVFRWLVKAKHLAVGTAPIDDTWKEDLKDFRRGLTKSTRDPEPHRPRHSLEEMKKIWAAAPKVDPRAAILIIVGAGLRPGQVARAMRSDLKLDHEEFGTFQVFGAGHKAGETVYLTKGMRIAIDVYLAGFMTVQEELWLFGATDYPLFPAGRLLGRKAGAHKFGRKMRPEQHVSRGWIIKNFHEIERLAGVPVIKGRGTYGMRRAPVDLALEEELGDLGLQALGGWSSTAVPKHIYAEKESKVGRRQARDFKAKMMGEGSPAEFGATEEVINAS